MQDWEDHLTTIFPEIRLKRFLEMRGADGGPWNMICALPAFWVGLLYDEQALAEAEELMTSWTTADMLHMQVRALLSLSLPLSLPLSPLSLSLPLSFVERKGKIKRELGEGLERWG